METRPAGVIVCLRMEVFAFIAYILMAGVFFRFAADLAATPTFETIGEDQLLLIARLALGMSLMNLAVAIALFSMSKGGWVVAEIGAWSIAIFGVYSLIVLQMTYGFMNIAFNIFIALYLLKYDVRGDFGWY